MIIGWRSPLDGRVYDLYDFDAIGRSVPEAVMRAMVRKLETDKRHRGANITITSGLSCPRKTLVHRMLPTTPDPSKMWKMQRGTWLHECIGMSLGESDEWITEEKDADACTFEGELFGVKMSCRVDAIKADYSQLVDWKFRSQYALKFIDPMRRARDEDASQMNMARMLIEQNIGRPLPDLAMYVWVVADEFVRTVAPHMTTGEIGRVTPGGGAYTVDQIFTMLNNAMVAWKAIAKDKGVELDEVDINDRKGIINILPMVGEKMYRSKDGKNACSHYCEVREECYDCAGGI